VVGGEDIPNRAVQEVAIAKGTKVNRQGPFSSLATTPTDPTQNRPLAQTPRIRELKLIGGPRNTPDVPPQHVQSILATVRRPARSGVASPWPFSRHCELSTRIVGTGGGKRSALT